MAPGPNDPLDALLTRYPALTDCRAAIEEAGRALIACFKRDGKLLVCGNGGSASDAGHIVGELMKGFRKKRPLPDDLQARLAEMLPREARMLVSRLQGALPAVDLTAQTALLTATGNDLHADLIFAQQVLGYGRKGDILLGLSTSGGARDVINALCVAESLGLTTIGLTGRTGGEMAGYCRILIRVPADGTPEVQELHLPVYHALCAMVEDAFFRS